MNINENSKMDTGKATQSRKMVGFVGATCSLSLVYAASSAPIPLYNTYREVLNLTSADLSMTAVAYFVGTVSALLFFARLSDYLGRRPVILATLGLTVIGCGIFVCVYNASMLLLGRFVQGVACGLASSAITAYIVETAPTFPDWISAVATGGAPMFGLAAGSLGAGALRQYGSGPLSQIFGIIIVALVGGAAMIAAGPETIIRTKGAIAALIPRLRVQKNIQSLLPAASCTFVGTWAVGGFFQAFSSSIAAELLHTTNTLAAAAVFACLMAPNVIGGSLAGRLKPDVAQRVGMLAFFLCMMVIIVSLKVGSMIPFLIASVFSGIAWGVAFTGSMRGLLTKTSQENRSGVLSAIFLIAYSGAAVPNLIVARLPSTFSLFEIAVGYDLLVAVACVMTLLTIKRQKQTI